MVLRDGTLPTAWLSSRKNSVLRCIERLCAETASEHRRAQRRLQEVEEAMATQNQPGSNPAGADDADRCSGVRGAVCACGF